ncbi:Cupredoxin [Exophiala viscosa]|uniref:Cupredoxin n=1 Tax=Exophiala viscosa TaxID=2486360 RepID=A0AAN6I8G8_9EURO|nr:Cupredoxin [Exophiala viscosa]
MYSHSLALIKLFVLLFVTRIAVADSTWSTTTSTTTSYSPSSTLSTLSSTTTSTTPYYSASWTTTAFHNQTNTTTTTTTTTTKKVSSTSSYEVLTTKLPQHISDIIFPTAFPFQRPVYQWNIPSGRWGLSQAETNGKALLGTIEEGGKGGAPQFPAFIGAPGSAKGVYGSSGSGSGTSSSGGSGSGTSSGSSSSSSGVAKSYPWGSRTAGNTNPYSNPPNTGVVRSYDFVIERATMAPDGVERAVIVINGQFPGPTIEANWGDTIEVTVTNLITDCEEGTSLHWHGLLQQGTPWEDGVPGITQCPLAPGQSFTYSFKADLYGTSWYHAHYSAQYAAGLFGAMVIHGPTNADYDADLGPVLLTDYYHDDYFDIVAEVMGTDLTKVAPYSDNNLINGKGSFDCSSLNSTATCTSNAGYSKFQFTKGQKYRLRLINAGAEGMQHFSIDNHQLTVIAYDFVPIQPVTQEIVTLGVGQRADVIVEATGGPSDIVWMRSVISNCSLSNQPFGYAMVYYENANTNSKPNSTAWPITDDTCANDDLSTTTPYFPITPPATPATEVSVDINFGVNSTGHLVWTMDNSTFRTCYNDPALFRAQDKAEGNTSFVYPTEWNVHDFGTASSIRVIVNNLTPVTHPMHIHGHNMYVLAEGMGEWDGTVVNPSNPTRRDTMLLRPADSTTGEPGYMVFQIDADNPGMWPFHCHIAWHVSGGLYMNILEQPDKIPTNRPSALNDMCTAWAAFTGQGEIDQIDSGL